MKKETIFFDATGGDNKKIAGYFYPSEESTINGVVQICHGMAEYIGRYEEFIDYLNKKGWHVCGMDMMGHGGTLEKNRVNNGIEGYFGEQRNAIFLTVKDIMEMHNQAKIRFGEDLPYVLYGHSMGSFVTRAIYSTPDFSKEFAAFTVSSTMGPNPVIGVAIFLSTVICKFRRKKKAKFMNALAFGSYNKRIPNPKSEYDWITTDEAELDIYLDDPMLGFVFTNKGMFDLFQLVRFIQSDEAYAMLAKKPIFFTYGEEDPVGSYGEGVREVIKKMEAKKAPVKSKNYGKYRHEIQHEPVREEYFRDIEEFFRDNI